MLDLYCETALKGEVPIINWNIMDFHKPFGARVWWALVWVSTYSCDFSSRTLDHHVQTIFLLILSCLKSVSITFHQEPTLKTEACKKNINMKRVIHTGGDEISKQFKIVADKIILVMLWINRTINKYIFHISNTFSKVWNTVWTKLIMNF